MVRIRSVQVVSFAMSIAVLMWNPVVLAENACLLKANDLRGQEQIWQRLPCSCCTKFCGQTTTRSENDPITCDGSRFVCEVMFGKCRIHDVARVFEGKTALDDERKIFAREMMLGQRLTRKNRSPENWAIGLGFLFGIISIVPFLFVVRIGRLQARKERATKDVEAESIIKVVRAFHAGDKDLPMPSKDPANVGRIRPFSNIRSVSPVSPSIVPTPGGFASPSIPRSTVRQGPVASFIAPSPGSLASPPILRMKVQHGPSLSSIVPSPGNTASPSLSRLMVREVNDNDDDDDREAAHSRAPHFSTLPNFDVPDDKEGSFLTKGQQALQRFVSRFWSNAAEPDGQIIAYARSQSEGRLVANEDGDTSPQRLVAPARLSPIRFKRQLFPSKQSLSQTDDKDSSKNQTAAVVVRNDDDFDLL